MTDALELVDAASRDVRRLVGGYAPTAVDVPAQVQAFADRISAFPGTTGQLLVPLTPTDVEELTTQAARRLRPFNREGHGFRDAAIWQTVKTHAKSAPDTTVAFVSDNWKEFGQSKKGGTMHADLQAQLAAHDITNVRYYTSIPAFLQEHLLPAGAVDLNLYPGVLSGDAEQLEPFLRTIQHDLYVDEEHQSYSGKSLELETGQDFAWVTTGHQAYKLNDQDTYVVAKVEGEMHVMELRPAGFYTDPNRDELYEEYSDHPMTVSLKGTLAVTLSGGVVKAVDLLNVHATGIDDYAGWEEEDGEP